MGFTSTTVKYVLFFFNFFIALCGATICGISIYVWKQDKAQFSDITKQDLTTPCIILAIAGALVFLVAFLGCCGAIQESSCMMILYAIILLALIFLEAAVIGLTYWKKNELENTLSNKMADAFANYNSSPPNYKSSIDEMQKDLKCCGTTGPSYWHSGVVPDSCLDSSSQSASKYYQTGCIDAFKNFIQQNIKTIINVALGIGIAEIIGVIFGLYYASHIRRYSERGYA
uniref:Tetraspanin n=1 Tax=Clastoptera arizonana TaxID=38151 RepID=A0A1B6ECZ7_9HEMI